jgi:hypothetical protein
MAGAIDLFSGQVPIAGPNLFKVNKSPLDQLSTDISDAIGKSSFNVGGSIVQQIVNLIEGLLGITPGSGTGQTIQDVMNMFSNVWTFLGDLNPTSPNFNPIAAVENFIITMINPTNLLAPLEELVADVFTIPQLNIPGLDASKITSGQFPQNMIIGLETDLANLGAAISSGSVQAVWDAILASVGISAGTGTQPQATTYFTNLLAMFSNPNLISTGFNEVTAVENFITNLVQPTNLLAPLEQSVPGTFTVPPINVPGLDASKIISGVFPQNMVNLTNIPASIVTGVLGAAQIPGLDATKIISGVLAAATIPNITAAMSTDLQTVIDGIYQAMHGGSSTGNLASTVKAALLNIPGVNVISTLLASVIPGLDATKIVSGVLALALIPALPATIITSGVLNAAQIPGLDASKIISGVLATGQIPSLPASQITSGTFGAAQIPGLDATKIVSGVFATAQVSWAAPIDTLVQAWGGTGTGHSTADLTASAQSIGTQFVQGVLGGVDVGASIESHVDALVQAIQSNSSTGNSLGVLSGAMGALRGFLGYTTSGSPAATSVAGIGTSNSQYIANTAVTKPIAANIDPTMISVFNFNDLKTAALTTVGATQTATLIGFITATEAATKQSIQWLGYPTGGNFNSINDIRLNIYKMVGGTSTFVYQTPNLVAAVASGSSPVWNAFNLPSANYLTVAQGDIYVVELQVFGPGTYNVVGVTSTIPQHLTAIPAMSGATRNNVTAYGGAAPVFATTGGASGGNGSATWTHTFNGTETFLILGITYNQGAGGGTLSASVGGRACTINTNNGYVAGTGIQTAYLYPPAGQATFSAGPQTVTLSMSGYYVGGNSFGYSNCAGFNTSPFASGSSLTATQSITNKPNARIFQVISGAGANLSGYTQTQRFNQNFVSGSNMSMLVGDMAGTSGTVTGAATLAASGGWGSQMVELIPATPPTTIATPGGSSAFQYSAKTPGFGLSGAAGQTQYPPQLIPIYASQTLTNPTVTYPWANWFDVVLIGGGGGGAAGGSFGNVGGNSAGQGSAIGLTRAQMGASNLTWTIGGSGNGGTTAGGGGGNGTASSCVIPGYGTVSANGGAGAPAGSTGTAYGGAGQSEPALSWSDHYGNSHAVAGGAGGSVPQGSGGQPGGGGAGGNAIALGAWPGGAGGPGIGYILCYM